MHKLLLNLLVVFALSAVAAMGSDNTLGTWKLNMEKSKFSPAAPVKNLTTIREAADGGVKVTSKGEQANGDAIDTSYTAKYDGSDSPVTGAPWDTIAIKQVNANTLTATAKKSDGKYHSQSRTTVSSDGKTMTTRVKGTNAEGQAINFTMVYDKQ